MRFTTYLRLERETKGAVLYIETNDAGEKVSTEDAILKNAYIRKSALKGEAAPPKFTVTLES